MTTGNARKGNVRSVSFVSGDVQDVGYRGLVLREAMRRKLRGSVKNLPDGRVRIICQGDRVNVDSLLTAITTKRSFMHVDEINTRYAAPGRRLPSFRVEFSSLRQEMFQGFATAGKHLGEIRRETHRGFARLEKVTEEGFADQKTTITKGFESTHRAIVDGFQQTGNRLDSVDSRMQIAVETLVRMERAGHAPKGAHRRVAEMPRPPESPGQRAPAGRSI